MNRPKIAWRNNLFQPSGEQANILVACGPDGPVIIEALAGAGKTTTLCMAALTIRDRKLNSRPLLMLAHSEAGVVAIRDRFKQIHQSMPPHVDVMTIEDLCEKALKQAGDPVKRLDGPSHKRFVILQALQALQHDAEKDPHDPVHEFLSGRLDVDRFLAFESIAKRRLLAREFESSGESLLDFCAANEIDYGMYRLYAQYERLRCGLESEPAFYGLGDCTLEMSRQAGELDWGAPHPALEGRFGAVIFDELHDIDAAALAVLGKMLESGNGFFVGAGDFNQHILEGAISVFGHGMERIQSALPPGVRLMPLVHTRRFGPEICAPLNALFGVGFQPAVEVESAYAALTYETDRDCVEQILTVHESVGNFEGLAGGVKHGLTIILRNPRDSVLLEWHLGHAGIHYACQGMSPFYMRREVALVVALMWARFGRDADNNGKRYLSPGIVTAAAEGLHQYGTRKESVSRTDIDQVTRGRFDLDGWRDGVDFDPIRAIAENLYSDVEKMRTYVAKGSLDPRVLGLQDTCSAVLRAPDELLDDAGAFCSHTLIRRIFEEANINPSERVSCLENLESLARLAHQVPVSDFLGLLTLLATSSIHRHREKEVPTARLLTIEASKGREFPFVLVPYVERGRFPGAASHNEAYRERNMLYVAMTRAKTLLWLIEGAARPVSPGPV